MSNLECKCWKVTLELYGNMRMYKKRLWKMTDCGSGGGFDESKSTELNIVKCLKIAKCMQVARNR